MGGRKAEPHAASEGSALSVIEREAAEERTAFGAGRY